MKEDIWHRIDDKDIPFDDMSKDIIEDPRRIFDYLKTKIYGQDKALISAAMLLYNHAHGRPQRAIFMGPTGCGKTEIFRVMKEIYPYIIITNAAAISKTGLVGDNPSSCLKEVKYANRPYIVCLDEFDKLCESSVCTEADVQAEFLAMIHPSNPFIRIRNGECSSRIKIDKFSWALIGSFASTVEKIAMINNKIDIDENVEDTDIYSVDGIRSNINIEDLIRYGGLKTEIAGRMSRLIRLNALTKDDYYTLIKDFDNGPLKTLEVEYGFDKGYIRKNIIGIKMIREIARDAYESGLGVRYAYARIAELVDGYIFQNFDKFKELVLHKK